ncbi:glycosyltransferase [Vibrio fluvialis]
MNVKVVHVINALEIGGVEVGALSLLNTKPSDYRVLTVKRGDENLFNSLPVHIKENIIVCNSYFQALYTLYKIRPKTIVSSLWRSHLITLIYRIFFSIRHIHFVHSTSFGHFFNKNATKLSLKLCHKIFCDSDKSRLWVEQFYNSKNTHVIPMNVSFSKSEIKKYTKELSFVYMGRFSKDKNLIKSLVFIKAIKDQGLSVKFDLFGRDDGDLEQLISFIKNNNLQDIVTINSPISPFEVESRMREYNFYLQTSNFEGMAISVFQAVRNGLIACVTPVGEIKNYTSHMINSFHLDAENVCNSASEFISLYNDDEFECLSLGMIIDSEKYPIFSDVFFEKIKS